MYLMVKSNGGFRLTLNLKKLNKKVGHKKFKTEAITDFVKLRRSGMFMAKLNIRMLITAFLS